MRGATLRGLGIGVLVLGIGVLVLGLGGCGADDGESDQAGEADETAGETAGESGPETGGTEADSGETGDTGDTGDTGPDTDDTTDTDDTSDTGDPGPAGIFVAVGDGGRRASSTDGIEWATLIGSGAIDTEAESGEEDILRAVASGDGVIVAVGGGGTDWSGNAMIMRSTDGIGWDEDLIGGQPELSDRKLSAVGFIETSQGGVFIAGGHQTHVLRSVDAGLSWARVYPEHHASTTVFGVAGHDDTVVLVGLHQDNWDQPKVSYVQRSTDAGESFEAPAWFGVDGDQLTAVASNGEAFVAVGGQVCLRSEDGVSWEPCGIVASGFGAVTFTNDRFVVTYLDGVSTSSDGLDWSVHVQSRTGVPAEVVYGNGVYAGVRFYDRGVSDDLGAWSFVTQGGFPLRDVAFLPLR